MYEFIYMISWYLIYALPILLFIIGGVKFFVARKKLSEDSENIRYKKALLVAKELLVSAILLEIASIYIGYFKNLPVGDLAGVTELERTRMSMERTIFTYFIAIFSIICSYISIFCMIKKEIKKEKEDSLYIEQLKKNNKIINIIFVILLIIYLCMTLVILGEHNSIEIPVEYISLY